MVITLEAVARGDSPHFSYVCSEVSKGVAAVARDTSVPVIFGVLTTDTLHQALERAGIKSNLGWSYALQALKMGSLMGVLPCRAEGLVAAALLAGWSGGSASWGGVGAGEESLQDAL